MKTFWKRLFIPLTVLLLVLFFLPGTGLADDTTNPACGTYKGIVPCGPGCECEFCDFFVMTNNVFKFFLIPVSGAINYGLPLVPAVAVLMIMIGGLLYLIGGVKPEYISTAKSIFTAVVIGLVISYGAWLIVSLFFTVIGVSNGPWTTGADGRINWFTIDCPVKHPIPPPPPTPTQTSVPTPTPTPTPELTGTITIDNARINGNNLFIDTTVKNITREPHYYTVRFLSGDGSKIDEKLLGGSVFSGGIAPGQTESTTLSTNWTTWNVDNIGHTYAIELLDSNGNLITREVRSVPAH